MEIFWRIQAGAATQTSTLSGIFQKTISEITRRDKLPDKRGVELTLIANELKVSDICDISKPLGMI